MDGWMEREGWGGGRERYIICFFKNNPIVEDAFEKNRHHLLPPENYNVM